jgi:hypothetical protein
MNAEQPATRALAIALSDCATFSAAILRRPLRPYQATLARAITRAAITRAGHIITAILPRQSGKNETLAHATLYLLYLYQRAGGHIIHAAPTYDPQARNALERIQELATGHALLKHLRRRDNTLTLGNARATFISANPREHPLVGLTASLALILDEAQDVEPEYARRALEPMRAATRAPIIATGTARHSQTYLAELERITTHRTRLTWHDIAPHIPGYAEHVQQQIAILGEKHPVITNEYECRDLDTAAHALDQRRLATIFDHGDYTHHPAPQPQPDTTYIATLDIAAPGQHHDYTVLALHTLTPTTPTQIITRHYWATKENILDPASPAAAELRARLNAWRPRAIYTDATGIGAGIATILSAAGYPIIPFTFTAASKSRLWETWLAIIETGRYHHYTPAPDDVDGLRAREQMRRVQVNQNGQHLAWGIPAHITWQHPITLAIEPLHDDHLITAAMAALAADTTAAPLVATSYQPSEPTDEI